MSQNSDCGCDTPTPIAPSGGLGSCESGLCAPHGFQSSGIIDVTGRVTYSDGTPSALSLNSDATRGAGPNGVQVFTRGSRALKASGCVSMPSGAAPQALPSGSDDFLSVEIKRDGTVEVTHASGAVADPEEQALANDLAAMDDAVLANSIANAQRLIRNADANGMTELNAPVDQTASLLFMLEREARRRRDAAPIPFVPGRGEGYATFIETAGAATATPSSPSGMGAYEAADAAYGAIVPSAQAAPGGTSVQQQPGSGGEVKQPTTGGSTTQQGSGPTTTQQADPAVLAAVGQGTQALITLLNNRLAAGDADRREQRLQEFQLELDRIRRESGGLLPADQNASIAAAMAQVAAAQQQAAQERAALLAASQAQQQRRDNNNMILAVVVLILIGLGGFAYFQQKKTSNSRPNPTPSRRPGHGGMNPYREYVERANRAVGASGR
jgi:hypothetical protein